MTGGKKICQISFLIAIDKKEHILVFLLPHITFTCFCRIPPLNITIYLKPNWKDMTAALSVVEVLEEVVDTVEVERVVEMSGELTEAAVVAHQFATQMVPLLVGL